MFESKYVVPEFSDIFENNIVDSKLVREYKYFIDRDNFYEIYRSYLKSGRISKEEMRNKFLRAPKLENKRDYEFAAANALYYLNQFKLESVDWVNEALENADPNREDVVCWFVKEEKDIKREKENTPEEFKKFGFIMDKKHMEIR